MSELHTVYALSHRGRVHWVGVTKSLRQRVSAHVHSLKSAHNPAKARWLADLSRRGRQAHGDSIGDSTRQRGCYHRSPLHPAIQNRRPPARKCESRFWKTFAGIKSQDEQG